MEIVDFFFELNKYMGLYGCLYKFRDGEGVFGKMLIKVVLVIFNLIWVI